MLNSININISAILCDRVYLKEIKKKKKKINPTCICFSTVRLAIASTVRRRLCHIAETLHAKTTGDFIFHFLFFLRSIKSRRAKISHFRELRNKVHRYYCYDAIHATYWEKVEQKSWGLSLYDVQERTRGRGGNKVRTSLDTGTPGVAIALRYQLLVVSIG